MSLTFDERPRMTCRKCPQPVACLGPYPDGTILVSHKCDAGNSWSIDYDLEVVEPEQHKGDSDG